MHHLLPQTLSLRLQLRRSLQQIKKTKNQMMISLLTMMLIVRTMRTMMMRMRRMRRMTLIQTLIQTQIQTQIQTLTQTLIQTLIQTQILTMIKTLSFLKIKISIELMPLFQLIGWIILFSFEFLNQILKNFHHHWFQILRLYLFLNLLLFLNL